ncbi:unnamed protein product [Closterium sp. Naga37s-1]|nr:unnamed protein product [Closterium sp. Naga37s-1]
MEPAGHRRAQSDADAVFTVADWAHERLRSFNIRKTGGAEGAASAGGTFSITSGAASVADAPHAPSPRGRKVSIAAFAGSANAAAGGRPHPARSPSARARRASMDATDLRGAFLSGGMAIGKSDGRVKGEPKGEEEKLSEKQQEKQEERPKQQQKQEEKQQQKQPGRQKKLVQASFVERPSGSGEAVDSSGSVTSTSLGGKEQLLLRGSKNANQWRSTIERRSPRAGGLVSPRVAAAPRAEFEAGIRCAGEAGVAERGSVAREDRRDERRNEKGEEKGGEKNEAWGVRKSPRGTKAERNFKEKGVRRDREDRRTRVEGDGAGRETMKERVAEGGWEERRKERREDRREEGTEEGRVEEREEKRAGAMEERVDEEGEERNEDERRLSLTSDWLGSPHAQAAHLSPSLLSQSFPFHPPAPQSHSHPLAPPSPFSFPLSPASPSLLMRKVWEAERACDSGGSHGDLYGLVTPHADDLHESWPAAAASAAAAGGIKACQGESLSAAAGGSDGSAASFEASHSSQSLHDGKGASYVAEERIKGAKEEEQKDEGEEDGDESLPVCKPLGSDGTKNGVIGFRQQQQTQQQAQQQEQYQQQQQPQKQKIVQQIQHLQMQQSSQNLNDGRELSCVAEERSEGAKEEEQKDEGEEDGDESLPVSSTLL